MDEEDNEEEGDGKRRALGTITKNSHSTKNKKRKDKHAKVLLYHLLLVSSDFSSLIDESIRRYRRKSVRKSELFDERRRSTAEKLAESARLRLNQSNLLPDLLIVDLLFIIVISLLLIQNISRMYVPLLHRSLTVEYLSFWIIVSIYKTRLETAAEEYV